MEEINKEEVNRYLAKATGLCYHEWEEYGSYWSEHCGGTAIDFECKHCEDVFIEEVCESEKDEILKSNNLDFFSPEGFFILWNWLIDKGLMGEYLGDSKDGQSDLDGLIFIASINPEVFPIEVYNYLRGRET